MEMRGGGIYNLKSQIITNVYIQNKKILRLILYYLSKIYNRRRISQNINKEIQKLKILVFILKSCLATIDYF